MYCILDTSIQWLLLVIPSTYAIEFQNLNWAHRYVSQEIENNVEESSFDTCDYITPDWKLLKYCGMVARCKLYHTERKKKRNKLQDVINFNRLMEILNNSLSNSTFVYCYL